MARKGPNSLRKCSNWPKSLRPAHLECGYGNSYMLASFASDFRCWRDDGWCDARRTGRLVEAVVVGLEGKQTYCERRRRV